MPRSHKNLTTGTGEYMKSTIRRLLVLSTVITLLQSGCVIGRRTIALPIPALDASTSVKGGVYIASITDNRVFENKPPVPSTPSVDGDVHTLSADQKAVMIGRQRNTYGMAMGDIALPAEDSVITRARLLLEEGLKRRGYQISPDASSPNSASISIDEFWAWFTPGFWNVSFESRVYCTITLKKLDGSFAVVVKGYGINHGQIASDANWQLAYDLAFRDFLSKLDVELDNIGY